MTNYAERYARLSTERLVELSTGELEGEARQALEAELTTRPENLSSIEKDIASRSDQTGTKLYFFRFLAKIVDVAITLFVMAIGFTIPVKAPMIVVVFIATIYFLIGDGLGNGQSFGKRIFGLQVIDNKSGRPAGIAASVIRNIFLHILSLIELILILVGSRRRIGDFLAGTTVKSVNNKIA